MPPPKRYTNDEVAAILRRAIERQSSSGEMTHDELVATAREIGVSPEDLEGAIVEEEIEREVRSDITRERERSKRSFFMNLTSFVVVNALLAAMNLYVGGAIWFPFVLAGWAFVVAMQAARVFFPKQHDPEVERAVRERVAAEVRARHVKEDPLAHGARELGDAVKGAVGVLLKSASEGLREIAHDLAAPPEVPEPPRARVAEEPKPKRVAIEDPEHNDASQAAEDEEREKGRG